MHSIDKSLFRTASRAVERFGADLTPIQAADRACRAIDRVVARLEDRTDLLRVLARRAASARTRPTVVDEMRQLVLDDDDEVIQLNVEDLGEALAYLKAATRGAA